MPLILYLLQLTGVVVVVVATYTETSAKANTVIGLTATISNTVMRIARRNGLDWRTKGVLHLTSLTNYHVRSQPPLLMAYSAITIPTSVEASRAFLQAERKLTVTPGPCQGYKRRLDALKPLKYLEQNFVPLAMSSQKQRFTKCFANFTTIFYSNTDCLLGSLVLANSTPAVFSDEHGLRASTLHRQHTKPAAYHSTCTESPEKRTE